MRRDIDAVRHLLRGISHGAVCIQLVEVIWRKVLLREWIVQWDRASANGARDEGRGCNVALARRDGQLLELLLLIVGPREATMEHMTVWAGARSCG